MARIRTIKPEALQHRKVGRLSDRAFRLWVGMLTQADDSGRLVADLDQLRVEVFAYHPRVTSAHVTGALSEIASAGLVRVYTASGVQYADFPSWSDHQRISHPQPSKIPAFTESSLNGPEPSGAFMEPSGTFHSDRIKDRIGRDQGSEGKGGESEGNHGTPSPERAGAALPWVLASEISTALAKTRFTALSEDRAFWQSHFRSCNGLAFAAEVLKADAWCASNPTRAPKRNLRRFLHSWFTRAAEEITP